MNARNDLPSWSDGPAKSAVLQLIRSVTTPRDSFVPPCERIAAFDDEGAQRELVYDDGAEKALAAAKAHGWTVVSVKEDLRTVF